MSARGHKRQFTGIDGCPDGWLMVTIEDADQPMRVTAQIVPDFIAAKACPAVRDAAFTMIDMPIGLMSVGRRACETMARKRLKGRTSSVFAAPRRPMLDFETYAEANAWGKAQNAAHGSQAGGGLSKQAWMIVPRIREIDAAITPADQDWLGEAHPELAFARLRGSPCQFNKKTLEGRAERIDTLNANGLEGLQDICDALRASIKARFAPDDFFDACAIALTARARHDGTAWQLWDGTFDARGLRAEIWG